MNSNRLYILAQLREHGPMHGHQIRLRAEEERTTLWTDMSVGALYGALGRLQREGLIEAVRTEREGNYPERVVYAITEEGQRALVSLIDRTLRHVGNPTDPFDLALVYARPIDEAALHAILMRRIDELRLRIASLKDQIRANVRYIRPVEQLASWHVIDRLQADIAWHQRLLDHLPEIIRNSEGPVEIADATLLASLMED